MWLWHFQNTFKFEIGDENKTQIDHSNRRTFDLNFLILILLFKHLEHILLASTIRKQLNYINCYTISPGTYTL